MSKLLTKKDEKEIVKDIITYCVNEKKFRELCHIGKLKRKEIFKWWCKFSEERYNAVCLFTLDNYLKEFIEYFEEARLLKTPEDKLLFAIFGGKKKNG